MKGQQKTLGDDHPYTLEVLSDFAVLRRERGQYVEAENRLIKAREEQLSKLYKAWGQPEEANQWQAKLRQKPETE